MLFHFPFHSALAISLRGHGHSFRVFVVVFRRDHYVERHSTLLRIQRHYLYEFGCVLPWQTCASRILVCRKLFVELSVGMEVKAMSPRQRTGSTQRTLRVAHRDFGVAGFIYTIERRILDIELCAPCVFLSVSKSYLRHDFKPLCP